MSATQVRSIPRLSYLAPLSPVSATQIVWLIPLPAWLLIAAGAWFGITVLSMLLQKIRRIGLQTLIDKAMIIIAGVAFFLIGYPWMSLWLVKAGKEIRHFFVDIAIALSLLIVTSVVSVMFYNRRIRAVTVDVTNQPVAGSFWSSIFGGCSGNSTKDKPTLQIQMNLNDYQAVKAQMEGDMNCILEQRKKEDDQIRKEHLEKLQQLMEQRNPTVSLVEVGQASAQPLIVNPGTQSNLIENEESREVEIPREERIELRLSEMMAKIQKLINSHPLMDLRVENRLVEELKEEVDQ